MDYNTEREKLIMPEYGRGMQQLVNHCKSLGTKAERHRCALSIIKLMGCMTPKTADKEDFQRKLWNHLAAISNYELDIDYPVAIERKEQIERKRLAYPQQRIMRRHYGHIVEEYCKKISSMEDKRKRSQLAGKVANIMKRDLAAWNIDAMSDAKVADDLAQYTGQQELDPAKFKFVSDQEVMNSLPKENKKKKKKK